MVELLGERLEVDVGGVHVGVELTARLRVHATGGDLHRPDTLTPMMLPLRVARDAIAPWEVALALGLLVFNVWLLVRVAGRVYEFTLLHTGSRVGWGQLLRLSRGVAID